MSTEYKYKVEQKKERQPQTASQLKLNTRTMTTIGLLVAVCAVCAQISIPLPFSPVPFTLQTLAVMVTALLLGGYGPLAILVYLAAGMVGLPVFSAGGAGFGVVAGPTGGFIWGFLVGAIVISLLKNRLPISRTWLRYTIVAALGLVPVYGLGMIQLAVVTDISLGAAFMGGVFPYLPLEAVKVLLAVRLVTALEKSGVLHR